MNRDFYFYANLFLGLSAAGTLSFAATYFLVGPKAFGFGSFTGWLVIWTLISTAAFLFLLRYYQFKRYRLPFWTGVVAATANVLISFFLYIVLRYRELQNIYVWVVLAGVVVGLVYSVSLIFSEAGKHPWLRSAGIMASIINVGYGFLLLWSMGQMTDVHATVTKVDQYAWLFRSFLPVFFIMHLRHEYSVLKSSEEPRFVNNENYLSIAGSLGLIAVLFFGGGIAKDGITSRRWDKVHTARAERLVKMGDTRIFTNNNGDSLSYLLIKPVEYNPEVKYPLVVCLPYRGYQSPPADLLGGDINRKRYPAFLMVPYSSPGTSWGGVPEYAKMTPLDDLVYETLLSLNEPGIDIQRIYVSGVSLGGYGSWQLISKHPDMFAAAIPVCGAGDPGMADRILNVAVWAFHGANDVNVPVGGSRDMIEAIREAGGDPKYTEYGHLAHNIWHEVSKTPGLLDWLFAQRRDEASGL